MKIKIAELSSTPLQVRRDFWQQSFSSVFEVEWVDALAEIGDKSLIAWAQSQKDLKAVLIDDEHSISSLLGVREVPAEVKNLETCDGLIFELGHWIPRLFLKEAVRLLITKGNPSLDIRSSAYITGRGGWVRASVAVAVELGFSRIRLVDEDLDTLEKHALFLRKKYFGIDFLLVKDSEITLQPSNGTLLINTVAMEQNEGLIEDLSYMNYLKREGLIVDLSFDHKVGPLAEEAENVGIAYVSGAAVAGVRDYEFLKKCEIPNLPSFDDYQKKWMDFVNEMIKASGVSSAPSSQSENKT